MGHADLSCDGDCLMGYVAAGSGATVLAIADGSALGEGDSDTGGDEAGDGPDAAGLLGATGGCVAAGLLAAAGGFDAAGLPETEAAGEPETDAPGEGLSPGEGTMTPGPVTRVEVGEAEAEGDGESASRAGSGAADTPGCRIGAIGGFGGSGLGVTPLTQA
jgi:hypothetical protein